MLTRLRIRNFKTLQDVDIPLGQNVVLIGPNNSGRPPPCKRWRYGTRESENGPRVVLEVAKPNIVPV